jgi:hypothetical protein
MPFAQLVGKKLFDKMFGKLMSVRLGLKDRSRMAGVDADMDTGSGSSSSSS